jgi:ubiquinone/menaquinone biosynthesis C-methylase UbiE
MVGAGKEYANWQMRPGVIGDAHHLPFGDASVDVVALMHVLEHVVDPQQVFAEISRVMRPGGLLFVDVPFMYQIHHAPNDHFRFTPYAVNSLADRAGLRVREIRPSGGYARFMAYALRQAPRMIRAESLLAGLVRLLFCWPLVSLGYVIDKIQYIVDMHDFGQELVCGYHANIGSPIDE